MEKRGPGKKGPIKKGPKKKGAQEERGLQFLENGKKGAHFFHYLPPGSPEGDYNLHHVRVYVRACVRVSRSFL